MESWSNYHSWIIGRMGCGAFGNAPNAVARYFKKVLIDEEYGRCFDEVCFAIYGKTDGKNINAFRGEFEGFLKERENAIIK